MSSPKINIRQANLSDLVWINEQYSSIGFLPSVFDREFILIAEVADEKAGIGRIVFLEEGHVELGGIFVLPSFRKKGIARLIVKDLIYKNPYPTKSIWCIPFENLKHFYGEFGFKTLSQKLEDLPKLISEKMRWCAKKITRPVVLMQKKD